jgi:hypothetical protein
MAAYETSVVKDPEGQDTELDFIHQGSMEGCKPEEGLTEPCGGWDRTGRKPGKKATAVVPIRRKDCLSWTLGMEGWGSLRR